MRYLLDTNVCIRLLNSRSSLLAERLSHRHPADIVLCAMVKAELVYGAYHSHRTAENLRVLERFFWPYESLPFDDGCLETYGRIRNDLTQAGTPIGPNDLLIAAIAVTNDLTLVTSNVREFSGVIGLKVEDWERDDA